MRHFEFRDSKSAKFWAIDLAGRSFTVTYGKIGSAAQTQTRDFQDEATAKKECDKLIAQKLAKSYVETTPKAPSQAGPARPTASLRDALEAAVEANPDDLAAHSALADYLQEHGDPRGEFIAIQLALEDPTRSAAERKKLQQREQLLLDAHHSEWVDAALPPEVVAARDDVRVVVTFRRGQRWGLILDYWDDGDEASRVVRILAAALEVRWVRDLRIEREPDEGSLGELAGAAFTPFLRRLHIGEGEYGTHASGTGVARLVAACGRLQELAVYAHLYEDEAAGLFAAPMPALRDLAVCCTYHYPLDRLAKNKTLTQLRTICFFPHRVERGDEPYLNADGLRVLGASKYLPALADLTFKLWGGADAADALVQTGLLFRLERLDLSNGSLTDAEAQALAGALKARTHRLRLLDVSDNSVTPAGADALRSAGVQVECRGSYPEGDRSRFHEGDVE
jgi:uncharacterized protein (TIGR02996 family)